MATREITHPLDLLQRPIMTFAVAPAALGLVLLMVSVPVGLGWALLLLVVGGVLAGHLAARATFRWSDLLAARGMLWIALFVNGGALAAGTLPLVIVSDSARGRALVPTAVAAYLAVLGAVVWTHWWVVRRRDAKALDAMVATIVDHRHRVWRMPGDAEPAGGPPAAMWMVYAALGMLPVLAAALRVDPTVMRARGALLVAPLVLALLLRLTYHEARAFYVLLGLRRAEQALGTPVPFADLASVVRVRAQSRLARWLGPRPVASKAPGGVS
ncbi:MAG: hypothetical protein MUF00_06290 [Gemmatimonadaceae bacterium]|jgi:hypothetical protein|nr:hypothetical protein [Gemmatimonadaceae bacterium]